MKYIDIDVKIFNFFLRWYDQEIEKYKWIPITVADRVNIFNQKDEMIAYKEFGLIKGEPSTIHYIREDEWNRFVGTRINE